MKAIVLLFTKSDAEDSKNFPFAGLTKINVTVEGNSNDVYSKGLAKRDMYDEARRLFGSSYVSRRQFYTDKFACVVDFRTVNDESVSGSGRRLIGTQAGVLLEIEKEATATGWNYQRCGKQTPRCGILKGNNEHTLSHVDRRHDRLRKDALPFEDVGRGFLKGILTMYLLCVQPSRKTRLTKVGST